MSLIRLVQKGFFNKFMPIFDKEYENSKRINTLPFRSFFVPFNFDDEVKYKFNIIDKYSSKRIIPLNGNWKIKEHKNIDCLIDINESLNEEIKVPGCVQLFGYDYIQYVNTIYPFKYDPPFIPKDNPVYHYRRNINIKKERPGYFTYGNITEIYRQT